MTDSANTKLLDLTAEKIASITDDAYKKLLARIAKGDAPQPVIAEIQAGWAGQYQDVLVQSFSDVLGRAVGTAEIKAMKMGDMVLSEKLYQQSKQVTSVVGKVVSDHVAGMQSARDLALKIYEGYGFKPDPLKVAAPMPKYFEQAELKAKFNPGFKALAAKAQAMTIKTPALRVAYLEAFDALAAGAGAAALEKKLNIAFYERNRYFANRIAQTELARVQSAQRAAEIMADKGIEVVQYRMSATHPRKDICDLHARVNKWGLGAGCYPKAKAPVPPMHPFCRCKLSPRIDLTAAGAKEIPGADKAYIQNLDGQTGAAIMGSKAKRNALVKGGKTVAEIVDEKVPEPYRLRYAGAVTPGPIYDVKTVALAEMQDALKVAVLKAKAAESAAFVKEAVSGALGTTFKLASDTVIKSAQAKTVAELKDAIQAEVVALKAKWANESLVATYKKNMLEGKKITAKQQAAFDSLDPAKKGSIQASIDAVVQPIKQVQSAKVITQIDEAMAADASAWKKVGPQKGSNPGGSFVDEHGTTWYIKLPAQEAIARNEFLASKLYQLAGIDVADVKMVTMNGKVGVASRWVDGLVNDFAQARKLDSGAWRGFATDAWLANWDAVGLSGDNLLLANGKAFRVDVGGSMLYRAQGGLKGADFGKAVKEFKTLRDPKKNSMSAGMFNSMDDSHMNASVAHVLSLSEDQIRNTVMLHGPGSIAERKALADLLLERQATIAKAFPDVHAKVAGAVKAAGDLVKAEADALIQDLNLKTLEAVKSVKHRADSGLLIESAPLTKVAAAREQYSAILQKYGKLMDGESIAKMEAHFGPWLESLEDAVSPGMGAAMKFKAPTAKFDYWTDSIGVQASMIKVTFEPWMFGAKQLFTEAQAEGILRSIGAKNWMHYKNTGWEAFKNVPLAFRNAIGTWTAQYYQGMFERALKGVAKKYELDYFQLVGQAIEASPRYSGPAARGIAPNRVRPGYFKKTIDELQSALDNNGFVEFMTPQSAKRGSKPLWAGDNPNEHIVLHFDESTRGSHVKPISSHESEDEILFPPGRYRVIDATTDAKTGVRHFYLKD